MEISGVVKCEDFYSRHQQERESLPHTRTLCACVSAARRFLAPCERPHIFMDQKLSVVYIFIWAVQLTGPPVDYADATGMDVRKEKTFYLGIARLFV